MTVIIVDSDVISSYYDVINQCFQSFLLSGFIVPVSTSYGKKVVNVHIN